MSIIFLKDVYRGLVPENPTAVSGATFGGASNLGTYKWINIEDKDTNLLGETGFMFARFNCAPEPLEQVDNALVMIHRRHQSVPVVMPAEGAEQTGASSSAQNILSVVSKVTPDDTSSTAYREVEVVAENPITDRIGDEVTVVVNTTTYTNVIVTRDYANGRYRIAFQADGNWASVIQTALTASQTVTIDDGVAADD